uniref:Uncharacterized protein n=1 Tax=Pithovirus LCPAC202 TaxID=2506592 RepID=A0A481Z6G4_9VIRU|nr:MAG: hypothetical protein LCPAC202_01700 [Pithovirus LCPAC202]
MTPVFELVCPVGLTRQIKFKYTSLTAELDLANNQNSKNINTIVKTPKKYAKYGDIPFILKDKIISSTSITGRFKLF